MNGTQFKQWSIDQLRKAHDRMGNNPNSAMRRMFWVWMAWPGQAFPRARALLRGAIDQVEGALGERAYLLAKIDLELCINALRA